MLVFGRAHPLPHQLRNTLELLYLVSSLVRLTRQLPASIPDFPFVLVAGATTLTVTVLRPFVTRDTWRRVLSASTWPRLLSYVAGKVMVGGGRHDKICGCWLAFACCCCYRCCWFGCGSQAQHTQATRLTACVCVFAQPQVAYLGFRRPDFAAAGELSGKQFVMEGLIVPATCLVGHVSRQAGGGLMPGWAPTRRAPLPAHGQMASEWDLRM